jgi:hypothetical protein
VAKKSSAQTVQRKRLATRTAPTTADCMYVSVRGVARRAALLVVTGDGRRGRNVQHATAKIARITYASLENVFQRIGRLARIG